MTTYNTFEDAIANNAKGTDLVRETCGRCLGRGNVGYGRINSTHYETGAQVGSCFDCFGRGTATVRVSSIKARVRREAKRAEEAARVQAEAEAAKNARTEWNASNPYAVSLLDELADREREQGLAYELLVSYAIPTDAQIDKLREIKAQREEREAARRPVITGKAIQIEGEVISKKEYFSYYGHREQMTYKMVVRDDRGFKVWGSVPSALDVAKGDRVRFVADVDASDREDSFDFGFFKRPRKAERV